MYAFLDLSKYFRTWIYKNLTETKVRTYKNHEIKLRYCPYQLNQYNTNILRIRYFFDWKRFQMSIFYKV